MENQRLWFLQRYVSARGVDQKCVICGSPTTIVNSSTSAYCEKHGEEWSVAKPEYRRAGFYAWAFSERIKYLLRDAV